MLRIMLISMFDFQYIYIYGNHKTLISHHGAQTTITTIYIIVIEVFCMHLLLCAIYQN